ncbi:MAG: threonine ammonia-lyase [Planctomycetes bacterium]|nr:threonine ammonia-lyase [Planctomycetota bacterium]
MVTLDDVKQARERIRDEIYVSPFGMSQTLSKWTGYRVYLKLENLQMTGSFKERGALNKILDLTAEEKSAGVIAASAGNHAQGLAYHAVKQGIKAVIVMPEPTPLIKVAATREHGAEVILHGATYDDAYEHARELEKEKGLVFVHPFNDPLVVAGQGSIGLEMMEQVPEIEAAIVPVGGGGLISGIAIAMKETNPKIKIIGVEAENCPAMKKSLEKGGVTDVPAAKSLADGIAVKRVGELTYDLVQNYVDQMVTVTEEEIAQAILTLIEREKSVVEGAGAATLAAVLHEKFWIKERNIGLVLSGGNIDVNILSRIIERGLAQDGRLVRMRVAMPDAPGVLHEVSGSIAKCRGNIVEVQHDRAFSNVPVGIAHVIFTMETRGREHIDEIKASIAAAGYDVQELE